MTGRRGFLGALLALPFVRPRGAIDSAAVLRMRERCRTAKLARWPLHPDAFGGEEFRKFTNDELLRVIRENKGDIIGEFRRLLGTR